MPRAKKAPVRKTCAHCSTAFSTTDSRKLFCSRSCKDTARNRALVPVDALTAATIGNPHQARRSEERRAAQEWMYETIYSTAAAFRADVVMALLVFAATSQNSANAGGKRYRDILTYPTAQRSNRFTAKDKGTAHLHYRGQPLAYPVTIASMANHVCKCHLGMSSSEFLEEIKRDGVTLADMQAVYDELMDPTKPEPVIRGCDVEEPANGPAEPLTASQIVHAYMALSDLPGAARRIATAKRSLRLVNRRKSSAMLQKTSRFRRPFSNGGKDFMHEVQAVACNHPLRELDHVQLALLRFDLGNEGLWLAKPSRQF